MEEGNCFIFLESNLRSLGHTLYIYNSFPKHSSEDFKRNKFNSVFTFFLMSSVS